jgi:hypothetical protein
VGFGRSLSTTTNGCEGFIHYVSLGFFSAGTPISGLKLLLDILAADLLTRISLEQLAFGIRLLSIKV